MALHRLYSCRNVKHETVSIAKPIRVPKSEPIVLFLTVTFDSCNQPQVTWNYFRFQLTSDNFQGVPKTFLVLRFYRSVKGKGVPAVAYFRFVHYLRFGGLKFTVWKQNSYELLESM